MYLCEVAPAVAPELEERRQSPGKTPAEERHGWILSLASPHALATIGLAVMWLSAALYEPHFGIIGFVIVAAALAKLYRTR